MSVPLLRWPGGNFTRDYRWRDGLLPVDNRPPVHTTWFEVLALTDNWDFQEIGTDEFIALCRELGAEPSLTINLDPAMTTPEDAAAWVEYCNGASDTPGGRLRAQRGHPEPYGVKYWFVGNEVWGFWMGPVHCDASTYAKRFAQYAAAMKKADPLIRVIASGLPRVWDDILLAEAGSSIDTLSEHYYAKLDNPHVASPSDATFAHAARRPREFVHKLLAGVREQIETKARDKGIKIAFNEWNVWHDWFAQPMRNEWHVSAVDGVYAAAMLNMLCREQESLGLCMAAFFEPVNEGCIVVGPFEAQLTTVGQVFELFRRIMETAW